MTIRCSTVQAYADEICGIGLSENGVKEILDALVEVSASDSQKIIKNKTNHLC